MKMRKLISSRCLTALVFSGILTFSMTACGQSTSQEIRFGTGGTAGTYYNYGTTYAELTTPVLNDTTFSVKTTAGSAANIRLLSEGFLQLALVQNDMLNDAYAGVDAFENTGSSAAIGSDVGYGAIAALYTESCQVVVPADSNITNIADLRNKTVSVGEEESGVLQNADQLLLAHGLTRNMLTPKYLSFSAAAEAMLEGKLDAIFLTAGAPTSAIENLAHEMDVRILSISSNIMDILTDTYSFYTPYTIPANTYAGQTEPVETVGVKSVLVASEQLSEETVEVLTASLFDHAAELQFSTPGESRPELSYALDGLGIPLHSGAANYYTRQGVDTAGIEAV